MTIIVGLGNPGKKYKDTRHNVGFQVIDEFAEKNNFPEFKFSKKSNALISKKDSMLLVKPQTFMNQSGKAVKKIIGNWKLEIGNLIVVHDDIDLPLEKVKIVKNRGAAGHKGVESVIKELGTQDFIRFRIGIQPAFAKAAAGKPKNVEKFVLQRFTEEEKKVIKETMTQVASELRSLAP